MLDWLFDTGIGQAAGIVGMLLLVSLIVYGTVLEQQQWEQFAVYHRCRIIRTERGGTATTILSDGKVGFTTLPDKTTYSCDDGREYVR